MALVLVADPAVVGFNSFLTLAEALLYFEGRITITEWEDADSQEALLVMATRLLCRTLAPRRVLVRDASGSYYRVFPTWTGAPTLTTQPLCWPRTGMFTLNGAEILSTVIPEDLKWATAELAGQLAKGDRTLDNDVAVQGITSVKAGSVAVTFKDGIEAKVLPDAVWAWLVASWVTNETLDYGLHALVFEAL